MLRLCGVSLYRGGRHLLENVDLIAASGHRIGIVGRNGSGKTSLLAMIRQDLLTDRGHIDYPTDWVLSYVRQTVDSDANPTKRSAIDYVLDGDEKFRAAEAFLEQAESQNDPIAIAEAHERVRQVDGYAAKARAARLLHGLGIDLADFCRPLSAFSGGWQMRLNLARALVPRSDILLLDEPTNHLDLDAIAWLERWLSSYQGVLLVVSHDRDFLDGTVNRIWHIDSRRIDDYAGNYSDFESARAAKQAQWASEAKRQRAAIDRIQRFVERFRAKATKAKQVQSRLKALEKLTITAVVTDDHDYHLEFLSPERQAAPLLSLNGVTAGYGEKVVLSEVNFGIDSGQRVAILGRNGSGKSTLMQVLAKKLMPMAGDRVVSAHLKVGYLAQHQLDAFHIADTPLSYFMRENPNTSDQAARDFLGRFGFGDRLSQEAYSLSGGEKTRLALAAIIWQRPNLLLLDEPTNHLDLPMRESIAMALQAFEGAVVLVSHDRHLIRLCADQLFIVRKGTLTPFPDDLETYQKLLLADDREKERATEGADNRKAKRREEALAREALASRRRPIEAAIGRIEAELEQLESERQSLESQMAESAFYEKSDRATMQSVLLRQAEVQRRLDELEAAWLDRQAEWETAGLSGGL